ncbi:uncharacterized protein LOC127259522 [Andrographis paniculata]|uniref:uncharacterized protein LOC127259522 n=1 Tax=Andrographis paniculata TaxID=175694 RepID=UPI0021E833A7|nr:uncharacterized protein LOC127259522 [Andrographis paniculata]
MHRSASTSRVIDDHYSYYTMSPSSKVPTALRALSGESFELPSYEPQSDPAKKEKARAKFAEKAVHLIPLVLLLCGFILWLFSNPNISAGGDVAIGEKVKGMAIDGDLDSHGHRHLPAHMGDIDKEKLGDAVITAKFPRIRS